VTLDVNAITTAVAARFAAAQVTPPTGYGNIRTATGSPPNAIPAMPAVVAFPEEGSFRTGNGTRIGVHAFTVRFYYAEARDLVRDAVALQKWTTVLVDQLRLSVQLAGSVAGVDRVTVDSWRIGILPYGTQEYSGIELSVGVETTEAWAAVA
jgi:hypothetical protein